MNPEKYNISTKQCLPRIEAPEMNASISGSSTLSGFRSFQKLPAELQYDIIRYAAHTAAYEKSWCGVSSVALTCKFWNSVVINELEQEAPSFLREIRDLCTGENPYCWGNKDQAASMADLAAIHVQGEDNVDKRTKLMKLLISYGKTNALVKALKTRKRSINNNAVRYNITEIHTINFLKPSYTTLHSAAKNGYKEVIDLLISRGKNINALDSKGRRVLHLAVKNGHDEAVQTLINAKVNLELASSSIRLFVAPHLIFDNTDHNKPTSFVTNETPLETAIYEEHFTVAKLLIHSGANLKRTTIWHKTLLLQWAAKNGDSTILRLSMEAGGDVNAKSFGKGTALHLAVENNHTGMVQTLINAGADVNSIASRLTHATPLELAIRNKNIAMIKLLLNAGAKFKNTSSFGLHCPLLFTMEDNDYEIIKLLIDLGISLEEKNYLGRTILQHAIENKQQGLAKLLIKSGADIHSTDIFGQTALQYARNSNQQEIIKLLIDSGASLENGGHLEYYNTL